MAYNNFVRPATTETVSSSMKNIPGFKPLKGDEAKEIYLKEIKHDKKDPDLHVSTDKSKQELCDRQRKIKRIEISDKDLFLSVQNNDVDTMKLALDACPDNVNKLDDYGWSLLMIACQANSIESVKELLKRGADTSIRDKAGNSAQSLIIKNKNYKLADLLCSNTSKKRKTKTRTREKTDMSQDNDIFFCDLCNIHVSNRKYHLSSTVHNINLSKGKKLPTNFVIPESNRGYQLMLKVGWDKESGLGPDGSGKKYPIKTVQKPDRKGLGHGKRKLQVPKETEAIECKNKKTMGTDHEYHRNMEKNFRRQFY